MTAHLQVAPSPAQAEQQAKTPISVVLADDHRAVRRSLRLLLDAEEDVRVVGEAETLDAVVAQVHGRMPNVLVLDLQLHNGSSTETIRRLRARAPDTEIVVVTMEASGAFARQALDAGAVGFVMKDRADSDLPAAVRCAVIGGEYVSPPIAARLEAMRTAGGGNTLSPRELEVLRLIALGYTNGEIARLMHLSRRTIESHRAQIHHKLALRTRAELVRYALDHHLLSV
jgi:two-component system response regulator NreC